MSCGGCSGAVERVLKKLEGMLCLSPRIDIDLPCQHVRWYCGMSHNSTPSVSRSDRLMLNGFSWNLQVSNPSMSSWIPKPPTSLPSRLCRTIPFWQQSRRQERLLTAVKLMVRRWPFDLVDSLVPSFCLLGTAALERIWVRTALYLVTFQDSRVDLWTWFFCSCISRIQFCYACPFSMSNASLLISISNIPMTWNSIDVFQKLHTISQLNKQNPQITIERH